MTWQDWLSYPGKGWDDMLIANDQRAIDAIVQMSGNLKELAAVTARLSRVVVNLNERLTAVEDRLRRI